MEDFRIDQHEKFILGVSDQVSHTFYILADTSIAFLKMLQLTPR